MNKKGLTLIERLAVIIVLAIISLIAVPVIIKAINEAKLSTAKSTLNNYKEALENKLTYSKLNNEFWEMMKYIMLVKLK